MVITLKRAPLNTSLYPPPTTTYILYPPPDIIIYVSGYKLRLAHSQIMAPSDHTYLTGCFKVIGFEMEIYDNDEMEESFENEQPNEEIQNEVVESMTTFGDGISSNNTTSDNINNCETPKTSLSTDDIEMNGSTISHILNFRNVRRKLIFDSEEEEEEE